MKQNATWAGVALAALGILGQYMQMQVTAQAREADRLYADRETAWAALAALREECEGR